MAKLEITKIEERKGGKLLYNVRVYAAEGQIEFPIGIQDFGSPAQNEAAVLRSTIAFAEELAASVRQRPTVAPCKPEAAQTTV